MQNPTLSEKEAQRLLGLAQSPSPLHCSSAHRPLRHAIGAGQSVSARQGTTQVWWFQHCAGAAHSAS
jgi:hypothetical protein